MSSRLGRAKPPALWGTRPTAISRGGSILRPPARFSRSGSGISISSGSPISSSTSQKLRSRKSSSFPRPIALRNFLIFRSQILKSSFMEIVFQSLAAVTIWCILSSRHWTFPSISPPIISLILMLKGDGKGIDNSPISVIISFCIESS